MSSFEDFYRLENAAVYRAAFLMSGDRQISADATQEAFARALERWRRLQGESWAGGWVMTTAMNFVRRSKRVPSTPLPSPRDYEPPAPDVDLWRAIRRLPRRQQEAVALHHLEDLSIQDCARVMQCSSGTVKTHLHRARLELQRVLGGERV